MANALIKHAEDITSDLEGLHHQWDHLVQLVEKANKELDQISNWVRDLLDQKTHLMSEIWEIEQELQRKKEE